MHNAAFTALGIDAVYLAFDVAPGRLGEAIAGARALGVRQLAVSVPHKLAVMQHLDAVDETARRIGAVNTVTLDLASTPHELLVNTTAVGLRSDASPVDASAIAAGSVVMDAVYDPEQTRLLRDAESRGARPLSGKWMLIHQAAEQLALWTGRDAPIDVMAEAFDRAGARSADGAQGV
jgi:shikimate dehydrogenase